MANSPSSVNGHESALNTALLKAISDCGDCIHKLKDDFVDSGYPITDDNTSLHRLSAKLEFLLQAHMKVRTGVLGKKRDYWDYMLRCLARRHVHDGIKFVKACPEYKTSLGRGRALLRFCLVHQCLADTIQQCVTDGETTSACYKSCSPLLRQELSSDLLDSLYILNEVKFDLNPTGHDLDVAWPTFSKTCGAGMLHWRPPSRTMSISSLDSSFSSYENGGALSSSLSEVHERNEEELMEYRMQVADLRATIEDLKSENRSLKRAAEKSTVHAALQTDQELEERVQENSERIMEQDNQIMSLRASMEARDAEMRTLSVTNSTLCEEIENLRIQLSSQAEDYSRVLLASEEAQNELVRLAAHVTEQQKIIEELESRFGDFEGDRSAELNQSMKLNESLQEELAEKIALAQDLERRVKKYSSAVSGLRDSFRTISRELLAIGAARATSVKGSPSSGPKDLWLMGEELSSKNSVNISDENDNDLDVIVGIESKVRWLVNSIQKHIGDFDSDNKLLREGLVHLLKEKDRLWQLNNRFVQLFRQLMRNDWADDDSASNCESCGASFSLMLRRHHCRLCGKFFCFSCSDYSVSLATTRGRNRVCRHCFALVQKIRLDVNSSIALEELESTVGDDEPSEEVQIEPLFRPVNVGFVESAAPIVTCARPASIGGTPPAGEEKFTVITGGEIASIRAEVAECPTYISCPSKLSETVMLADLVHCEEEGTPGNVRSLSKEGSFEDSDDWRQSNGRRGSDSNFQHSVEFWVTAKTSFGVPVSLPIHPCVLAWKVDTQAQMDLNFAVTYRTTGHVGSTECLHPIQRLLSGSCRGQLKIKRSGIYTFVFDNTFSSFKAKKVSLKLRLEKDQSSPGTPASSTTED